MKKYHEVGGLRFRDNLLEVTIDGVRRSFDLEMVSSLLAKASEAERETFEISPSGYGIHWPFLDEDISVDGLLGVAHYPVGKRKIA